MLRDSSTEPEFIGDANTRGELDLDAPRRRRRANSFGGREDLASVYAAAKDLIIKHKLLVLKQFEEADGVKRLTICNLWRIERHPDQSTTAFEFDLETCTWRGITVFGEKWPAIPIWPASVTKKADYWPTMIRTVIWKALIASGFNDLPKFRNPYPEKVWQRHLRKLEKRGYVRANYIRGGGRAWLHYAKKGDCGRELNRAEVKALGLDAPKGYKPEMTPAMMAYSLIAAYTTPAKKKKGKGWLCNDSMEKGARALRAALWEHILDRDVVSAQLALHRDTLSFASCLDWAVNRREHLLRVTSESRNLLPLLVSIDFKHWHRSDLFSRKLWVRGGRKSTPVDRGFYNASELERHFAGHMRRFPNKLHSFETKSGWRWLSNASMMIVKSWVAYGRDNAVATNLALATSNIKMKIPVVAVVRLIEASPDNRSARLPQYGVSPVLQQLYRLYLNHAAQLWADEGFKAVKTWAGYPGGSRFSDVVDYLESEGFAQGQPEKNSTWASLERRSADWHRRIAIQNIEEQLGCISVKNWEAAVPEIEIDGIVCRPLLSSREMAVEGYEMSSCVGGYTPWCIDGHYRVYSLLEPDGARSTLGLQITRRQVSVEQHRGKYNGAISPLAEAAGRKLAVLYRQALGSGEKHHSPRCNRDEPVNISSLTQPSDCELAELCAAVYDSRVQLVAGWQRVWEPVLRHMPADGGEGPTANPDEKSGFKATVFQKEDAAVLAFAGNESKFRDWLTNLKQGIGLDTAQYRQAVAFAQECKVHFGNNLTLTGHSLGGGLATLACAATGTLAVVFNPAGVHSRTFRRIGVDPEKFRAAADAGLVRAYVVKGEVLERVPDGVLPTARH